MAHANAAWDSFPQVLRIRTGVCFPCSDNCRNLRRFQAKDKILLNDQQVNILARRLLISAQANAKRFTETNMKARVQQLNMNDFTVVFLIFGLLVGLAFK
jgi:hypothetical protein